MVRLRWLFSLSGDGGVEVLRCTHRNGSDRVEVRTSSSLNADCRKSRTFFYDQVLISYRGGEEAWRRVGLSKMRVGVDPPCRKDEQGAWPGTAGHAMAWAWA